MAKGDPIVLWPRYFDASLSRAEGRRVTKDAAVKDPTAEWVHSAARKAGLQAELDEKARHPARPHKASGRVMVKGGGKEDALRKVAAKMAQ